MSNLLYSTQSVLSIKPFVYHVTTLENFKNWLASGIWQLASGNWQLAGTDWRQEELLNLYTFIPLRGATKKRREKNVELEEEEEPSGPLGRSRSGRISICAEAVSASEKEWEREREGWRGRRGESRLTIGNNQWEMRVHFRTFCINWKRVVPAQRNVTKRNESIRWHPQRPALKWFLIIFLNL